MKRNIVKLFLMGAITASAFFPIVTETYAAEVITEEQETETPSEESTETKTEAVAMSSIVVVENSSEESSESETEPEPDPSVVTIRTYNKSNGKGESSASVKIVDRRSGSTVSFDRNSSGNYTYNSSGSYRYLEPDSDGYIKVYGLNGSYTAEDAGASSDVHADTSYQDFNIYEGDTHSIQLDYVINSGSISIQLLSEDDNAISDACFILKNSSGNSVRFSKNGGTYDYANSGGSEEIATNTAGMATLSNIPAGTYTLEQTASPSAYNGDMVSKTIVVESQKQTSLTVVNTKQYGDLSIRVVAAEDNSVVLSGSEYYIKDSNGNFVYLSKEGDGLYSFSRSSTDYTAKSANGDITITGIPKGSYTLVEATVPVGFKPTGEKAFDIMKDYKTNVQIKNDRATGSLTIYVTDDTTGDPVKGFEYQLVRKDDEKILSVKETEGGFIYVSAGNETIKTDADGKIQISGIPTGTYLLKQVSAADGYLMDLDAVEQIIETDNETVFNTAASKSNSAIFITNNDGEPVAGVSFDIIDAEEQIILSDKTNENGKYLITGVAAGQYTLKITAVPEFYSYYKDNVSFSIDETGLSEGLGKIVLKYSEIKMDFGIQDLEVFLKNKGDGSIISVKTDDYGIAVFNKIAFGEYVVYLEKEGVDFPPMEVAVNETFESMDLQIEISSAETSEVNLISEEEDAPVVVKKKVNNGILVAIFAAIIGLAFGGYMYYEKNYKKKKKATVIIPSDNPNQFIQYDAEGNQIVYEIEGEPDEENASDAEKSLSPDEEEKTNELLFDMEEQGTKSESNTTNKTKKEDTTTES